METTYKVRNYGAQSILTEYWDDLPVKKWTLRGRYFGGNVVEFLNDRILSNNVISIVNNMENIDKCVQELLEGGI